MELMDRPFHGAHHGVTWKDHCTRWGVQPASFSYEWPVSCYRYLSDLKYSMTIWIDQISWKNIKTHLHFVLWTDGSRQGGRQVIMGTWTLRSLAPPPVLLCLSVWSQASPASDSGISEAMQCYASFHKPESWGSLCLKDICNHKDLIRFELKG